jgi:hypothetical protein
VAEHAEVVGRAPAVGVDVVDVEGDSVGVQRVGVIAEVLGRRDPGLNRRRAGVVLGGQDQHLASTVRDLAIGERVADLPAALEPDFDVAPGRRAADRAADHVVVRAVALPVALAAGPLRGGGRLHGATVELVLEGDRPEAALGQYPDLLRVAVGLCEPEVEQRLVAVLRVDVVLVQVERRDGDPNR